VLNLVSCQKKVCDIVCDLAPTVATLVIGGSVSAREAAIAVELDKQPRSDTALILEGMPDGVFRIEPAPDLSIARIAPGCFCCIGNLTLRVTLNRILRHPPTRLYISLASATHVDQLRLFLTQAPYDVLLALTEDMSVSAG
jgi:hypothetical protein